MLTQKFIVTKLNSKFIHLELLSNNSNLTCVACSEGRGCGIFSLSGKSKKLDKIVFERKYYNNLVNLSVGDYIYVSLPNSSYFISLLLLYVIPLAVFLISAIIFNNFFNELLTAFFSVFSLVLYYFITSFLLKKNYYNKLKMLTEREFTDFNVNNKIREL